MQIYIYTYVCDALCAYITVSGDASHTLEVPLVVLLVVNESSFVGESSVIISLGLLIGSLSGKPTVSRFICETVSRRICVCTFLMSVNATHYV